MTVARGTQVVAETVSNVTAKARATQAAIEVVSNVTAKARATQCVIEVVSVSSVASGPGAGSQARQLVIST